MLVSPQRKPFSLQRESILKQVLWFHVVDDVEMLNYKGMSAMLPVPTLTSLYSFHKNSFYENSFREIEFSH